MAYVMVYAMVYAPYTLSTQKFDETTSSGIFLISFTCDKKSSVSSTIFGIDGMIFSR